MARETCLRCGGTGNIPQYSHINNGVCFRCNGAGTIGVGDDPVFPVVASVPETGFSEKVNLSKKTLSYAQTRYTRLEVLVDGVTHIWEQGKKWSTLPTDKPLVESKPRKSRTPRTKKVAEPPMPEEAPWEEIIAGAPSEEAPAWAEGLDDFSDLGL